MKKSIRSINPLAKMFLGLLALGTLSSSPAMAASEFDAGAYLGIGYGYFRPQADFEVGVNGTRKALSLYAGYQFNDYIGLEAGHVNFDKTVFNYSNGTVSETQADAIYVRGNAFLPLKNERKQMTAAYLAGGFSREDTAVKTTDAAGNVTNVQNHENEMLYGAGIMLRERNSALRLEFIRFLDIGKADNISYDLLSVHFLFFF